MEHSIVILLALVLNAALCGPRRLLMRLGMERISAQPVRWLKELDRRLNREHRSAADREMRGWLLVAVLLIAGLAAGSILTAIFSYGLVALEVVLVAFLLPIRPIWDRLSDSRVALARGDLPQARQTLSGTLFRHYAVLDEYGVARASIETAAADFSEKIVAPALAYICFGLSGLLVCWMITLARDTFSAAPDFGKGAKLAQQLVQAVPSRVAAILWLLATLFLPNGDIRLTAKQVAESFFLSGPRRLMVRVAASVVRVTLGGHGSPYAPEGWVEYGPVKVPHSELKRAQAAYVFASIFLFLLIGIFF